MKKRLNPIRERGPELFIRNVECPYFPCHDLDSAAFNCKFCYCPLFFIRDCGGTYAMTEGRKDCSGCVRPHQPGNTASILLELADVVDTIGAGVDLGDGFTNK